ncbi:hypothetical protein ACLOJK_021316 [Asimina triloba]
MEVFHILPASSPRPSPDSLPSQVLFSKLPKKQPFPPNKRKAKHMDYIPLDCYSDGDGDGTGNGNGDADHDHPMHGERTTRINNVSYARDCVPRLLFVDQENNNKNMGLGLGLKEKISTKEKFQDHGKKDDPDGPTPIKKATELILSGPASPSTPEYKEKAKLQVPDCKAEVGGKTNRKRHADFEIQQVQRIKNSDLKEIRQIGSGTYGIVYYGKWKGSEVAIKRIKPSCFMGTKHVQDRLVEDFWKEATLLSQLHHPNVVSFCGVVTDGPPNSLAMITEYMVNGSLKQVLQKKHRTIDRRKRLIIAMDAALGMNYLHEENIVHFDLKSHNLLVNVRDPQRPVCKIGDFGLAKEKQNTFVSAGARGTLPWMAPELLKSNRNLVTEKVDVFSFGIVMWEILTGKSPYAGMSSGKIKDGVVMDYLRPEIPSRCDPAWRSLMTRCWSSHPPMRPSFAEIARELQAIASSMNIQLDSFRRVENQEAGRLVQLDKKLGRDPYRRPCDRCAGGQKTHANALSKFKSAFRCA